MALPIKNIVPSTAEQQKEGSDENLVVLWKVKLLQGLWANLAFFHQEADKEKIVWIEMLDELSHYTKTL